MAKVPGYVARIDASAVFADEVKSQLREKLFVGTPESPPKITSYRGGGPLGGWLRVTAIRVAQNLRRGRGGVVVAGHDQDDMPTATAGPELDYFKRRYGGLLREVLESVLTRLPREQRAVLRLHFVDGLTVRAIAKLQRVNASTASRWITQARTDMVNETRARLRHQLDVDDRALDSLLAMVESQVDLTLSRVLATASE